MALALVTMVIKMYFLQDSSWLIEVDAGWLLNNSVHPEFDRNWPHQDDFIISKSEINLPSIEVYLLKWMKWMLEMICLHQWWFHSEQFICKSMFVTKACRCLTHWGRDKMDTLSQTTFSSAFCWMKMFEFRIKFHWSLFPRVQLTIFHHWFR